MQSDKSVVRDVVSLLIKKGLKHVVISPGSRHAPLSLSFFNRPEVTCHIVPDERAAAYFALGIIQETQTPVACICTSGTAVANYTSAAAEAFYQELPLLLLSADRPVEWVDQGDGQTIRQHGVLAQHCLGSWTLHQDDEHGDIQWMNRRVLNQAWNLATGLPSGPIHLNIPLREPLYDLVETTLIEVVDTKQLRGFSSLSQAQLNWCSERIGAEKQVLLIIGLHHPDNELTEAVAEFAKLPQVTVLTETTSNCGMGETISCIDRLLMSLSPKELETFVPDLLITVGSHIVSKKIKAFLRKASIGEHWHIDPAGAHMDTFQHLSHVLQASAGETIQAFAQAKPNKSDYHQKWFDVHTSNDAIQAEIVKELPWCDMKAFQLLLPKLPTGSNFQMGNSSVVRYIQLYNMNPELRYFGNRGTSGIDGCTSTASGMAAVSERITTLVTGDIAFLYDINGLWHDESISNLKIILINNGGGGIFRIIDGPRGTNALETIFETKHDKNAAHLAAHFGLDYSFAVDEEGLVNALDWLYLPGMKLLEVNTSDAMNDEQLRSVFKQLKHQRAAQ